MLALNCLQIGVRESLWRSLEEEVIPSLPTARTNWLEVQSKFISRQHKESNICIVGGMKVKLMEIA